MRIVTVIVVAVAGFAMLPVVYTIINMIFISEITQGRVAISKILINHSTTRAFTGK